MPKRILIIGAGAVGCFYGSFFYKQDYQLFAVSRDANQFESKTVQHASGEKDHLIFEKVIEAQDLATLDITFDLILVATKVLGQKELIQHLIRYPFIQNTPIILMQNGYGIERDWLEVGLPLTLWRALSFVCVSQVNTNLIVHQDYGRVVIGPVGTINDEGLQQVVTTLQESGLDIRISNNIQEDVWKKQCWNVAFNGLSVTEGFKTTKALLEDPVSFERVKALMKEVQSLAQYEGIQISDELLETLMDNTRKMIPYYTSMCLDAKEGRDLEIQAIYKNMQAFALEHNCPTPQIDRLIQELERPY